MQQEKEPLSNPRIPVARPRLPSRDAILPYLDRIDQSRWYSNSGPLVQELQNRLAEKGGHGSARAAVVSNATIGITLALLAHDLPPGSYCMLPSWTFAATAHAIRLAGLVPWLVDVCETTWALEASIAINLLGQAPAPISAVVPVSPFGAPVDVAAWEDFRDKSGIPVIIDAAAGFDSIRPGKVPVVISLHATKVLGLGEGGYVLSTDQSLIEEIQKRGNFGFWNTREATVPAFNGKLSEYGAAVGLASLDQWPEIRADFELVAMSYRKVLEGQDKLTLQPGYGTKWITSTTVIHSQVDSASTLASALNRHDIGWRRWWGGGLHHHRAFRHLLRTEIPVTNTLAERTLGLPCWRELPSENVEQICQILLEPQI